MYPILVVREKYSFLIVGTCIDFMAKMRYTIGKT